MTFKSILFCLFLYVCLVWVAAVYFFSGPKIEQFGLLWTGAGLIAVLALMLLSRLFGWVRILRAKAASRPKPVLKPALPVHEDEAQLKALLDEANLTLSRVYRDGTQAAASLSSLPVYLLVGAEASGKTSTFLNAGLEPQLLAGDAGSQGPITSTRLCNIWLAQQTIFVELGGRLFTGDLARWQRFLRVLEAKPELSSWQKLWKEPPQGLDLKGVIAFCEVKEFTAAMTPQAHERLDRQFHGWQERLGAVADVFGLECPVTFLITKCDSLPYFSDFFGRLPESEIGQVLGYGFSTPANARGASAPSAEADFKRLTKSFNALFRSLADKRISHLAHEPDQARRPAIYEFPRELKRIRPALVQFLTAVFRPHALRPSPQLRGYYLSAIGEREVAPSLADSKSQQQWSEGSVSLEATTLFRGEATHILRGGGDLSATAKRSSGTARRWLFVSELFRSFAAAAPSLPQARRIDSRVERRLQAACVAVCAVCLTFCSIFITSWTGNLRLLHSVRNLTTIHKTAALPTLAELEALEDLRKQVSRLTSYDHDGPPLSLRWGLYSGAGILDPMRAEYFRRFQQLLLEPLNNAMTARLAALPALPGPDAAYGPVFRTLKAHLMISSGQCNPEPAFVYGVLKDTQDQAMPVQDSEWRAIADRQIQFYTSELRFANPCRLIENAAARDRARQYLRNIQGVDRLYSGILLSAEKSFSKAQKLADFAPNYSQVLYGPSEISSVFTRDGWSYVEKTSRNGSASSAGEACILGDSSALGGERKHDDDTARAIQRLFIRDYVDNWRKYLAAFSVLHYNGAGDAAHKLDLLSDHKSPLLALLAMTSDQTNFPLTAPEPEGLDRVKPVVTKLFPSLAGKANTVNSVTKKLGTPQTSLSTPADISRAFQPVHAVVPPGSETWVVDKNAAYVDALAALGHSMRDIARTSETPDAAVFQAASQNYDKALDAARQISRSFEPRGAGLDVTVERLIEAPIRQTQNFIPANLDNLTAGKVNGQLHAVCEHIRPTLHKYPFQPSSETDASLDEVSTVFAPSVGAIWKFQTQYLGDWAVKEGNHWKAKDPAKKPQITPEMLNFLDRAQSLSDVFYPTGSSQPQLTYTLRPKLDPSFKDAVIELDVDGQPHVWTSSLQKQFTWPPPAGAKEIGVKGVIKTGALAFPFTSRGGTWAIFRAMGDAEPRAPLSRIVEWKHVRGGGFGRIEEIQPVRLEFVEFPGGVDLFNPKFFGDLQCPGRALQ